MNIISVQPITDRPIIDAIAPNDFMLIGDASDNNVVKRVLVSSLKSFFTASSPTPTPTPTPTGFALRINCGGNNYVDILGNTWLADFGFTGGTSNNSGSTIANTLDDELYQSERYGDFIYSLPVIAGVTYTINLLLCEAFGDNFGLGKRVFRVKANNQIVLDNFDIFAEVGANAALIKSFTFTATSNILEISTEGIVENPSLRAIEILG